MVASLADDSAAMEAPERVTTYVNSAPKDSASMRGENAAETASKLAKLDSLLEKAGMYSSFLFSNMATAATVVHDEEDEEAVKQASGKRKRAPKKAKQGAKKLKQVQEDAKLDTRQQPPVEFQQPKLLTGGTLRSYQLEGIRWLCNLFENGLNGILADEMGLGKTIQVIGLIAHLKSLGVRGPYLIVAPLSTLPNWETEFQKWAPTIPSLIYHGTRECRKQLRKTQLDKSKKNDEDFPVIITSYEMILQDRKTFDNQGFTWKYVIIDEGHRLKNMNCKLVRELKMARSENRLLLTGTPLQNNLTELWSLLNFILPDVFDDLELFESWFSFTPDEAAANGTVTADDVLTGDKKAEIVSKLHEILRPFLLRRLKTDVITEMPSKTEIFVYCPMAPMQREYYRMIADGSFEQAMIEKHGRIRAASYRMTSLRNRAMHLRKCCNHPYLFDEPTDASGDIVTDEHLVQASGKLVVLDQMLRNLKRDGHKVLIFSQMTRVLDILQDFLDYRGYSFCRLDGSTNMQDRREQMDAFNASLRKEQSEDESIFCFLLSTRAGGLGINLIAADTVIFFDSDWNPQQDNQAQDRCHRIGQTKEIAVYRLITENSFENRMIKRAIDKRKLERVVIQRGHFKQDQMQLTADGPRPQALTNAELAELMRDDVMLRDGIESGGIDREELDRICDRQLIVKSFVDSDKSLHDEDRVKQGVLPRTSKGYEVVENTTVSVMESFA
ncbi:hypothetical protein Poli38472_002406 [Pythium oligandrum]|uniref:Uncharacterized protein n=1 Tax=Pythium oligandrum TaxID=41045 RepID=A0A8K1FH34_PYTOL|nr:hypothetical protein Poli38472_002406 [Pythium oligandrum]|eukprot:TMW63465.1 hypothetical protein Poli38472_002406 [Pythium oligandrum]